MRAITSGTLRRLLRPRTELGWVLAWLATLIAVEALGRRSRSDVEDAVGVALLGGLALASLFYALARRPAQLAALVARVKKGFEPFSIRVGLDLRGQPPLPERTPPILQLGLCVLLGGAALCFVARGWLPGGARELLVGLSAALYTALLTLLWALLALGTLSCFWVPVFYVEHRLRGARHPAGLRGGALFAASAAHALLLFLLASWLPPWTPLAIALGAFAIFALLVRAPGSELLFMLWKPRIASAPPARMRWSRMMLLVHAGILCLFLGLILCARGDQLLASREQPMPVTSFLGLALAWTFASALLVELSLLSSALVGARLGNPARALRPRVHVAGAGSARARRAVREALAAGGFRAVLDPRPRRRTDVPILLCEADEASRGASGWPRPLVLARLSDPAQHAALRRRAELLCRRALRKGLERILKAATARKYEKGSGFWIAPHLWICTHLTRDVDEDVLGQVGPSYASVIPLEARRHAWIVLSALEIDLIFLEDGVGSAGLKRVLAMLFEHYDIFGGTRPADERHFQGLPGIRVLIHDYVIDAEPRSTRYPEPDYEDLGRARILHIFRDRGGEEEEARRPKDADWRPVPRSPSPIGAR